MAKQALDGTRFGRWTVISKTIVYVDGRRRDRWLVRCDCGTTRTARADGIKSGRSKSCGCLKSELVRERSKGHGQSLSAEYRTWRNMKRRCLDRNGAAFKDYGGRGIKVCERWLKSFDAFFEDMGRRPSAAHSIDRIDNQGDYEPNNCRWATQREQHANRRNTAFVVANGERLAVSELAKQCGVRGNTVRRRLARGLSAEQAVKPSAAWYARRRKAAAKGAAR